MHLIRNISLASHCWIGGTSLAGRAFGLTSAHQRGAKIAFVYCKGFSAKYCIVAVCSPLSADCTLFLCVVCACLAASGYRLQLSCAVCCPRRVISGKARPPTPAFCYSLLPGPWRGPMTRAAACFSPMPAAAAAGLGGGRACARSIEKKEILCSLPPARFLVPHRNEKKECSAVSAPQCVWVLGHRVFIQGSWLGVC